MAFEEDLDLFFELDDFAVEAQISDPNDEAFDLTINVIFDSTTEAVPMYGDTNVEAPNPQFRCKTSDLVNVKRKFVATIASKPYKIERIEAEADGLTSIVFLST